jgi:hypothetical protein
LAGESAPPIICTTQTGGKTLPKFRIIVHEDHASTYEVEADTKDEAIQMINDCEVEAIDIEYSHTLDEDTWEISQI